MQAWATKPFAGVASVAASWAADSLDSVVPYLGLRPIVVRVPFGRRLGVVAGTAWVVAGIVASATATS